MLMYPLVLMVGFASANNIVLVFWKKSFISCYTIIKIIKKREFVSICLKEYEKRQRNAIKKDEADDAGTSIYYVTK